MTSSAHAARTISAAAALLCTGALAAACGSTSSNNTAGSQASPAATPVASTPSTAVSAVGTTAPATPPSTPSAPACSPADLSAAVNSNPGGAAAGSTYYPLNFTNTSKSPCYLYGYPGVSFVSGPSGSQIGEPASRNPAVDPSTVILPPGGAAHVTIQVVPFRRGGHAGAGGSFTVLRFRQADLPDVAYIEQLTSALYLERRNDVDHYMEVMNRLSAEALTPAGTTRFLKEIIRET